MELYRIQSSNLYGVAYDAVSHRLYVGFRSGYYYVYLGVRPELYAALVRAQPHPWTRFGAQIQRHAQRRIRPLSVRQEWVRAA